MTQCRTCQAEIRWVKTSSGKAMPLDAEPNPLGNVFVDDNGIGFVFVRADVAVIDAVYMPHFATCTNWRKT